MEQNSQSQQDKREERRRRRRRNQIAAYATVIVLIAVMAVGIVLGVEAITRSSRNQAEEQQSKLDEILATEETLQAPTEPTETVEELTEEQKLDEIVNAGIEVMPLEDKVAGLFLVSPESITGVSKAVQAGEGTQNALAKYAVGGIVYSDKNIQSAEQLKEMIDNTQLYTKYPLFIAVDEEGGSVSPVAEAGLGTKVDAAETIGETGDSNNAYQAGTTIGMYLAELGFNLDFAPVADLDLVENSAIGNRSFGADANAVTNFVTFMQAGLQEQKVTACLGHFPGIGSTTQDTADGLSTTDRSVEDFRANEFAVFQAAIESGNTKMIQVSHMAAPALAGDNTPCSLSGTVVTDILRNELNFRGVIITDALDQAAISNYYGADEAAVLALRAGCDMLYAPENFETAYNGVLEAVQNGTISEERINDSLRRIYRIKYADKVQ